MSPSKGLVAAMSLVLSLLAAELLVRTLAPQFVFGPLGDSVEGLSVLKPRLLTRMAAPGQFDVVVTTNAQRLRGAREYTERPAAGTLRIVAVGDSFTFGWGAGDDETYPARLEAWLVARAHRPVEVVNAGVPDTGTGDQALWYEIGPGRLHPALVILGVTYTDPADEAERRLFVPAGDGVEPRPIAERTRDVDAVRTIVHMIPGFAFLATRSHAFNLARTSATRAMRRRPVEGSAAARAVFPMWRREIAWFNGRLAAQRIPLVVAFLPERERVARGPTIAPPRSGPMLVELRAECELRGIPFLDATEAMRRHAGDGAALFFPRDPHPNPAGYAALATEVGAFLIENALVGHVTLDSGGHPAVRSRGSPDRQARMRRGGG